ncbi:hypothetical protein H4S02_004465 [Coemansia sp. RSA 2611]|nr:hypothetical protein LPJ70_004060 [Coemansia sp. RSA 2708]KAJ2364272.1 hypothetical protein H4S01_003865 [Coemansia sp. RSA 2610]KAJ2385176.1 hypothetical protein H4S02_004465 [Coemansia sp. RSA 2611]
MVLKSDDVNYLIYRYLKESGFLHTSYIFQFESQVHGAGSEQANVEPGSLIRVLQKGLQYMDVETHLNEDGTARLCTAPFSLVGKHVCSVQADARGAAKGAPHGGHTLVHDAKEKRGARVDNGDESESMDVDVPDADAPRGERGRRRGLLVDSAQLLRGHAAPVFLCAWSAGGVLATGAGDGTARIWDVARGSSVALRHEAGEAGARVDITAIAWSEQGALLATASFDGQLRVWTGAGELKQQLRQRRVPVIAVRWNRKGSSLLSAHLDGSVALWDVHTGQLRHELLRAHAGCVLDADWLDNSTFATCGNDRTVRIWRDGEPIKTLSGHSADINSIRWHPAGKFLASASDDGSVKVWSLAAEPPLVHTFAGHAQQVYLVKWLPRADKAILASASFDGSVRVWDAHNGACMRVLAAHTKPVDCMAFSPDGRYLVSGAFDKKVCVWSVKDGALLKTYLADDAVHDVQWAPSGQIAVAIASSHVAVFDPLSA